MSEKRKSNFAAILREEREKRQMTLEEMAQFLGTTKQVLSRYERGERNPKLITAYEFAQKLGISVDAFETGTHKQLLQTVTDEIAENIARLAVRQVDPLLDEMAKIFIHLSESEKQDALDYLEYLVERSKKGKKLPKSPDQVP